MNHKHILDLTLRLSQALDQNYDVVNMEAVISVISALEGTTITKEQLEATRLAKYINQLRRRTKSEHLARRAKSLLKKWREMVGIQQTNEQPPSTTVATLTVPGTAPLIPQTSTGTANVTASGKDNVTSSNLMASQQIRQQMRQGYQQQQQSYHQQQQYRSEPTSPVNYTNHLGGLKANAHVELLRSNMANSVPVSLLTKSANSTLQTSVKKRLDRSIEEQQQPTSFANLITGIGAGNNSSTKANVSSKSKKSLQSNESSNANLEVIPSSQAVSADASLIVIDLQDTNSGMNLLSASNTVDAERDIPDSIPAMDRIPIDTHYSTLSKSKKSRKEKKRKEHDAMSSADDMANRQNCTDFVDENSFTHQKTQQRQTSNEVSGKFVPVSEDKSQHVYPTISNISEILSLSNSSLSSIFPTENTLKSVDGSGQIDTNSDARLYKPKLSKSDLTFAGKFKQSTSAAVPDDVNTTEVIDFNAGVKCDVSPNITAPKDSIVSDVSLSKFVPFSGIGTNSNDSTSNSRTSQFDSVDVNPGENQKRLVDNLRLQQKQESDDLSQKTDNTNENVQGVLAAQQTVDLTAEPTVFSPEKKVPKKRGRKKGSKGVDSVIAKETSLSSQMLISSLGAGGKKVKTTKELYAEMKNRKLGVIANITATIASSSSPVSNWASQQQFQSRPESSCSEPSLYSPRTLDACSTNATISTVATRSTPDKSIMVVHPDEAESDSCTMTSEPSRDSVLPQKHENRDMLIDSNSNSHIQADKNQDVKQTSVIPTTSVIKRQLRELLKQLPAISSIRDIELECSADIVPCTCTITEIKLKSPNESQIRNDRTGNKVEVLGKINEAEDKANLPEIAVDVKHVIVKGNESVSTPASKPSPLPLPQKPMKSIFDLDFDDDEDPLHTIIAEAAASVKQKESGVSVFVSTSDAANSVKTDIVKNEEVQDIKERTHQLPMPVEHISLPYIDMPMNNNFPTYEIEEDPNCVAKNRFEIQTQKITKFHIDALHNCYIPNVNGNWNNADASNYVMCDTIDFTKIVDGNSVVPKYGSLINERIIKDLSDVHFTKKFKPKKPITAMEKFYNIPFLGVARRFNIHKTEEHKHEKCHKSQSSKTNDQFGVNGTADESKEEIANGSNFDFIKSADGQNQSPNPVYNTNLFVSSSTNNYNNLLKDITIDVEEGQGDVPVNSHDTLNGQTLLAIAKDIDKSIVTNIDNLRPTNERTDPVIGDSSMINENTAPIIDNGQIVVDEQKNLKLLNSSSAKNESNESESTMSRRSSSCSNSSLKHTQQSINLKLRRQRSLHRQGEAQSEEQQKECPKGKKRPSKNSGNSRSHCIKRIKIAINGDVATHRQISLEGSSNSTDEENNFELQESDGDERNAISDDNDDKISLPSVSQSSPLLISDEDIQENDEVHDIDDYEDIDFEEDDEEDYNGDYHEVVTRDISAPSTGNNHIVLTIKKTPSKTNSPNSFLATSPVPTSSVVKTGVPTSISSTNTIDNTKLSEVEPSVQYDNFCGIVEDPGISQKDISPISQVSTDLAIQDNTALSIPKSEALTDEKPFPDSYNAYCEQFNVDCITNKRRKLRKRRDGTGMKKLHDDLFFSHELCTIGQDGRKEYIFYISSCSSSCSEDSDQENDDYIKDMDKINGKVICEEKIATNKSLQTNVRLRTTSTSACSTISSCETRLSWSSDHEPDVTVETKEVCKSSGAPNSPKHVDDEDEFVNGDQQFAKKDTEYEEEELPLENNRLLMSFNNIYYHPDSNQHKTDDYSVDDDMNCIADNASNVDQQKQQQHELPLKQQLPNENCDDYNIYNSNSNFYLIKYSSNKSSLDNNSSCRTYSNDSNSSNRENNTKIITETVISPTTSTIANTISTPTRAIDDESEDITNIKIEELECTGTGTETDQKQNANESAKAVANAVKKNTNENSKSLLVPRKEYQTGIRAVDEDVNDEDGNNCARIQQFKEWHQVLQLRSYNDELLTVLPYVVLD